MTDELMNLFIITIVLAVIILLWFGYTSYSKKCMPVCVESEGLTDDRSAFEKFDDRQLMSERMTDPIDNTFQGYLEHAAVDQSVFDSHKRFISEAPHRTTVASIFTKRDDPNDINPFVGLRRPRYHTQASNQPQSRIVSSEDPEQMPSTGRFVLN